MKSSLLSVFLMGISAMTAVFGQPAGAGPVHQSIPSLSFGLPAGGPLSPAERDRITQQFLEALRRVNADAYGDSDPSFIDNVFDFGSDVIDNVVDLSIDDVLDVSVNDVVDLGVDLFVNPVGGVKGVVKDAILDTAVDWATDWLWGDDAADAYRNQRDFALRLEMEAAMTEAVNSCTGDINCIDRLANDLLNDPDIQSQFKEAGDLGIFDEAHARALIKSARDGAVAQYTGTVIQIENLDLKAAAYPYCLCNRRAAKRSD